MLDSRILGALASLGGLAVPLSAHADIAYTGVHVQQNIYRNANGVVRREAS